MNKKYTYLDGKVIIEDEEGRLTHDEYYDNLDEVLIQENVVETMEDRIRELESESEHYKNRKKRRYMPLFPILLIILIANPLLLYLLGNTGIFTNTVNTIFGTMSEALASTLTISPVMLPIFALAEYANYTSYKNYIQNEKGINSELEFLNNQIIIEKEVLKELEQEKTRDKENKEFRVVKVNDLEKLKILRSYLNMYYDLGYNDKKYYKYYKSGKLDEKLNKAYSSDGIELAKEYLEEKGPTLTKKH